MILFFCQFFSFLFVSLIYFYSVYISKSSLRICVCLSLFFYLFSIHFASFVIPFILPYLKQLLPSLFSHFLCCQILSPSVCNSVITFIPLDTHLASSLPSLFSSSLSDALSFCFLGPFLVLTYLSNFLI